MSLDSPLIPQGTTKSGQMETSPLSTTAATTKLLIAILIIATLLRVASAIYHGNNVAPMPGIYDQISYHGLAQRVAAGYGFSFAEGHWPATPAGEPTAHWSYLYTLYLATVYTIFGVQPLIARLIQAVVAGILHAWFAWRIGRHVFGPVAGLVAAGLSAVYIYFFYYAAGLLTETFYIIGILWTIDVALRLTAQAGPSKEAGDTPALKWYHWLELGLAIGLTVLLRQVFLLFVPFLFLWLWWNLSGPQLGTSDSPSLAHRIFCWPVLGGLLGATLIVVILIAPWTIRNYQAFDTFVPLNTNAGFAFFWGNHPIHGTNFIPLLPGDGPSYSDLIPDKLRSLNEAEMDKALLRQAMQIIIEDPQRFLLLSLSRSHEYFKFWPSSESSMISNISRIGSFGIILPFILYGLWLSIYRLRKPGHREQRAAIILLCLFVVVYTAIHLLTWTLIRYRLPVDAVLIIFAAYGLTDLFGRIGLFPNNSSKSK